MMKSLAGLVGAIIGAISGSIAIYLICAELCDGQDFGLGMALAGFGIPALVVGALCGVAVGLRTLRFLDEKYPAPLKVRQQNIILITIFASVFGLDWAMFHIADEKMGPPADQVFVDDFARHEAPLNQIVQMCQQDKNLRSVGRSSATYFSSIKAHTSGSRIAKYHQLISEAQVIQGFYVSDAADEIDFDYYDNGTAMAGDTSEGYSYLTKPPAHLVNNLDDYQPSEKDTNPIAFRHIQGNWYLYRGF